MPRLNHQVVIERAAGGALDDRGVPTQTWAALSTVQASVQPKSAREMAQLSQGGPVASDHTIYAYPNDIVEADRIVEGSRVFAVTGVRDAAGAGHHMEIDAMLVTGAA